MEVPGPFPQFFCLLGACLIAKWFIGVHNNTPWFFKARSITRDICGDEGSAVITGCTDGIGLALTKELVARKVKRVILISRTQEKLDDLKKAIQGKDQSVECEVYAFDFSKSDLESYERLEKFLSDKNPRLLINNVGLSYPHAKFYDELSSEFVSELINLNVCSTLQLSRIVMAIAKRNNRSCTILNMGSAASVVREPLLVGYAASKAAVETFSRALSMEFADSPYACQCQTPLMVTTKMSKIRHPSLTVPTPKQFAKASVNALTRAGLNRLLAFDTVHSPWFAHRAMLALVALMPAPLWESYAMSRQMGIRARALKKQAARTAQADPKPASAAAEHSSC